MYLACTPFVMCTVYHTVRSAYAVNVSDGATSVLVDTLSLDLHCCPLRTSENRKLAEAGARMI